MGRSEPPIAIYLEIGKTRTFAGAVQWPGWCRGGRDSASAMQALVDYGPRYAQALRPARLGFRPAADVSHLRVVEKLRGNSTTDFGAPDVALPADTGILTAHDVRRYQALLRACWRAFDAAAAAARGKPLRKGPRGGGRELDGLLAHVVASETSYLKRLAGQVKADGLPPAEAAARVRQAILDRLVSVEREGMPARGPRGGKLWTAHYFLRRAAWHVLDHAWEIEDRILESS